MRLFFPIENPPTDTGRAELHAALHAVLKIGKWEVVPVRAGELLEQNPQPGDVIWWHWPSAKLPEEFLESETVRFVLDRVKAGLGMVMTLGAAAVPAAVGIDDNPPDLIESGRWRGQTGPYAKRGMMSFGSHPILFKPNRLGHSVFPWTPQTGEPYWRIAYNSDPPERSITISCHFFSKPDDRACMWEYFHGEGTVVCLGAYMYFNARRNYAKRYCAALLENCIEWASDNSAERNTKLPYWPKPDCGCVEEPEEYFARLPETQVSFRPEQAWQRTGVPSLPANKGNHVYSSAARRMLLIGHEGLQIDEIWSYPVRLLREMRWAINPRDGHPLQQSMFYRDATVFPDAVHQRYENEHFGVREQIGTSIWKPAAVQQLEVVAEKPFQLIVHLQSDMEMMWPMPNGSTGKIHYHFDPVRNAILVMSSEKDCWAIISLSREPEDVEFEDVTANGVSRLRCRITFPMRDPGIHYYSFAVIGGRNTRGFEPEVSISVPGAIDRSADHYRRLKEKILQVNTPDAHINRAMFWSQIGIETFRAVFPNVGRCMNAGYTNCGEGWLSTRPGYAWFFGRDSLWTSLGCLATGRWNAVSDALRFCADHQAIGGKIYHETSASAYTHYDAADSNLLYLIVAERYLAWTADSQLIEELLPSLRRALEFSMLMDNDGDGLTENTGVGHGWIEGGGLFGAHVTFYLAGLWLRALEASKVLFANSGDKNLLERIESYAALTREAIHTRFWDEEEQTYFYGLQTDGNMNSADTIMPSAAIQFGLLDPEQDLAFLRRTSGPDIVTDWGARMISDVDERYNPVGYHIGSVWPLYTGWLALAQYARGRSLQGFDMLWGDAFNIGDFSVGYFNEVLRGDTYAESGVCPQQCWGAALFTLLFTTGMLGFDAETDGRIRVCPDPPPQWKHMQVHNIRWSDGIVDLDYRRDGLKVIYTVDGIDKGERIQFAPYFPKGSTVESVRINGRKASPTVVSSLGRQQLQIPLDDEDRTLKIEVRLSRFVSPLPALRKPEPGKPSRGFRIIDWNLGVDHIWIELMGLSGSEDRLQIIDPGAVLADDEMLTRTDGETVEALFRFPESSKKYSHTTLRFLLKRKESGA